tara:strand:+ start:171 stop:770 length:600 start_codon:yes stop_codon:yes gene_type:complete
MTMNGMIYKIEINEENIYVGSTTEKLCSRQSKHNYEIKRHSQRKLYKTCIENNIDSIKCIWVADVEYNSIEELRMLEESYRKELNGNLNMIKCYLSKEEQKEYWKNYREENKDKKDEYHKKYREENKSKIKEYYEENKSKISEKRKKFYEKNKSKINKYKNEKIKCEKCNSFINRSNISVHHKSNKCILLSECIFSDDD